MIKIGLTELKVIAYTIQDLYNGGAFDIQDHGMGYFFDIIMSYESVKFIYHSPVKNEDREQESRVETTEGAFKVIMSECDNGKYYKVEKA